MDEVVGRDGKVSISPKSKPQVILFILLQLFSWPLVGIYPVAVVTTRSITFFGMDTHESSYFPLLLGAGGRYIPNHSKNSSIRQFSEVPTSNPPSGSSKACRVIRPVPREVPRKHQSAPTSIKIQNIKQEHETISNKKMKETEWNQGATRKNPLALAKV